MAAYYLYLFRIDIGDNIDKMLFALTLPIATSAALIIKKLRQGKGFYFLFAPFRLVWYIIQLPAVIILDIFRSFHISLTSYGDINRRNKTINTYKSEITRLNQQIASILPGLEGYKVKQDKKIRFMLDLEMKIFSLEKLLKQKLENMEIGFENFQKTFNKEIKNVQKEMRREHDHLNGQVKILSSKIYKTNRKIDRNKEKRENIREGIEMSVQKFNIND